jgi:hypothetical protein
MAGTLLIAARKESGRWLNLGAAKTKREIHPHPKNGDLQIAAPRKQLKRKKGQADETTWPFG